MMMTGALSIEVRVWAFHENTCVPTDPHRMRVVRARPCCLSKINVIVRTTDTCMWSTPIILSRVTFDLYTAIILSSNMSQVIESIAFERPLRSKVGSFLPMTWCIFRSAYRLHLIASQHFLDVKHGIVSSLVLI